MPEIFVSVSDKPYIMGKKILVGISMFAKAVATKKIPRLAVEFERIRVDGN